MTGKKLFYGIGICASTFCFVAVVSCVARSESVRMCTSPVLQIANEKKSAVVAKDQQLEAQSEAQPEDRSKNLPKDQPEALRADESIMTGIMLDTARRYYTIDEIKKYIDALAYKNGAFLHLHLTDNENVGVECELLGQTTAMAHIQQDGSYLNPHTGRKFLSRAQIADIMNYARDRQVVLMPEIDLPAHVGGFFDLAHTSRSAAYVASIAAHNDPSLGELNLANEASTRFAEELYAEYAALFAGVPYFHMGCDELFFARDDAIVAYINRMANFLRERGFVVCAWNDLFTKKNLVRLPSDVQVTYWSFDGDTEDEEERAARRRYRASVPDLQQSGFRVLNYNSYYLYFVPSPDICTPESLEWSRRDIIKRWDITLWDGESGKRARTADGIVGVAVAVWGEDSRGVSGNVIYTHTKNIYNAMTQKVGKK